MVSLSAQGHVQAGLLQSKHSLEHRSLWTGPGGRMQTGPGQGRSSPSHLSPTAHFLSFRSGGIPVLRPISFQTDDGLALMADTTSRKRQLTPIARMTWRSNAFHPGPAKARLCSVGWSAHWATVHSVPQASQTTVWSIYLCQQHWLGYLSEPSHPAEAFCIISR